MGSFNEAGETLEQALGVDYECAEVLTALKSAQFWIERSARLEELDDDFERGEYLMKHWGEFTSFIKREEGKYEEGLFAVKQWAFGHALSCYLRVLESTAGREPELLYRIGRCYKGKGDYKRALEYLEACNHQRTDDPQILAELADCYAFINEMKASKAFFREAFFLDPQRITIESLESKMIRRLVGQIKSMGLDEHDLREWIPVYGVVFGVFNVKRELRSLEYGKLKQSIYALESKIEEEGRREHSLEPRLLNRYFWLIDHYLSAGDDRDKIDDVLVKIRVLNPTVYEHYIN